MPNPLDEVRNRTGFLLAKTVIGSYPLVYFTPLNRPLCPSCANLRENNPQRQPDDKPFRHYIHYYGDTFLCSGCRKRLKPHFSEKTDLTLLTPNPRIKP